MPGNCELLHSRTRKRARFNRGHGLVWLARCSPNIATSLGLPSPRVSCDEVLCRRARNAGALFLPSVYNRFRTLGSP